MNDMKPMEERFDGAFPFSIIDWRPGQENDGDGVATDKMRDIKAFIALEILLERERCLGIVEKMLE